MTKILLLHAYSEQNKGDAAILSVMLRELKQLFPDSSLRISSLGGGSFGKNFEGTPIESSLFYEVVYRPKNSSLKIVNLLKLFFGFGSAEKQIFLNSLSWADICVGVGGGYINSRANLKSAISLWLTLKEFRLVQKKGKPLILFSQSIGPFAYSFQMRMAGKVLRDTKLIFVREHISLKLLKNLGVSDKQMVFSPDAAFMFSSNKKQEMADSLTKIGVDLKKSVVGLTVRNFLKLPKQQQYEETLVKFIDWLAQEKQMQVLLIPQVTSNLHNDDDREVQKRIISKVNARKNILSLERQFNPYEIKGVYENMDFLIGTRMHSVIFALTGYVPSIAIAYEYKTIGIMEDLGLGKWVLKIENLTNSSLIKLFNCLINHKKNYLEVLNKNLPSYIEKAKQALPLLN